MTVPLSVAQAIAAAADTINATSSLDETLQAIVDIARDSMPDIDHVGITIRRRGSMTTDAATDTLVHTLDQIQYELNEGPCVDALNGHDTDTADASLLVVAEHLRHEGRWHDFVAQALPHGVRAVLAVRLRIGPATVGALNMYSTHSETIDAETRTLAELFATHAAYAYGHTHKLSQLEVALKTREIIGNAVGVLMERYGLSRERAFEYLVRTASSSEIKLRVVAEELLEQTTRARTDGS